MRKIGLVTFLVAMLAVFAFVEGGPAIAQDMGPLLHPLGGETVDRAEIDVGKRADGSPLTITLSTRKTDSQQKLPVVILLHGGVPPNVPNASTWPVYRDWGAAIAASGAAAIMFDHTLGFPKRELDRALGELDSVLGWVAANAEKSGLDRERVTIFTFSAGGLFVPALVDPARPLAIHRIAMFYPLTGIVPGSPTDAVTEPDLAARMTLKQAAASLATAKIRLLILRAGADEVPGLRDLLDGSIAALIAADARLELLNLPAAPHSFDFRVDSEEVRGAIDRAIGLAIEG